MNKSEFLTRLSGKLPYSKDEIAFLFDIIGETIVDGISSDGLVRTPIGKFKLAIRKARKIRNISNGEFMDLPECKSVNFSLSKHLEIK